MVFRNALLRSSQCAAFMLCAAGADAAVTYDAVAVVGQTAPSGGFFVNFLGGFGIGSPVISNSGDVAFRAFLGNVPAGTTSGVFVGKPGALTAWARAGAPVPGGGTFGSNTTNQVGFPIINSTGAAGYLPTSVGGAIVVGTLTGPTIAHRAGHAAPGLPGVSIANALTDPALNASGNYAFIASLSGGGFDFRNAIISNHAGALTAVAYTTQAAHGAGGVTYAAFGAVALSDTGAIFFDANFSGGAGNGIFTDRDGALTVYVRNGHAAPGTPGVNFSSVRTTTANGSSDAPAVSGNGRIAFRATLSDGSSGLFTDAGGPLRKVARLNESIPGFVGATWGFFNQQPPVYINNAGHVVFHNSAFYSGFFRDGVYVDRLGVIERVAHQTDATPITGLNFGVIDAASVRINNPGLIAFAATLTGPGVTGANDRALFATESIGGPLVTIIREGDLYDVFGDESDMRTIAYFEFSRHADSFSPSHGATNGHGAFNDNGTLVFLLGFTDGTQGIFTATIPAPNAATLLACVGLAAARRRR